MRIRICTAIVLPLLLAPCASLPALAQQDVRGVANLTPELRVIDEKCLKCHNRTRIDEAVQEKKDIDKVLSSMEKKGVVLTDKDRSVIGHFWRQKLFKKGPVEGEPR
jgi:hypothetical protein